MAQSEAQSLRSAFLVLQMSGVVSLIEMIEASKRRNREILEIGSSSLGNAVLGPMAEIYNAALRKFPDQYFSFFYIGGRGRPLYSHLELLRQVLVECSPEQRNAFDRFCGVFAESQARLNRPHVRIPNAIRQTIIRLRERLGLPVSDELLLGVSGWWKPSSWSPRPKVDVRQLVR